MDEDSKDDPRSSKIRYNGNFRLCWCQTAGLSVLETSEQRFSGRKCFANPQRSKGKHWMELIEATVTQNKNLQPRFAELGCSRARDNGGYSSYKLNKIKTVW